MSAHDGTPTRTTQAAPAMPLANRVILISLREAGVGVALILITLVFAVVAPYFATADNFLRILGQISINTILAVGMTFVILIGGIDLSVGPCWRSPVVGASIMVSGRTRSSRSHWRSSRACRWVPCAGSSTGS